MSEEEGSSVVGPMVGSRRPTSTVHRDRRESVLGGGERERRSA